MIACGKHHSLIIDPSGITFAAGDASTNNSRSKTFLPVEGLPPIFSAHTIEEESYLVDYQGGLWSCKDKMSPYCRVLNLPSICKVSCGARFSLLLDNSGQIWSTPDFMNEENEKISVQNEFALVNTTEVGKIINISCGKHHCVVQNESRKLWGAGKYVGTLVHSRQSNRTQTFQEMAPGIDEEIIDFGTGYEYTIVLGSEGTMWGTGSNVCGQLGLGNRKYSDTFVRISSIPPVFHVICGPLVFMAMDKDGMVYTSGINIYGEMGLGNNLCMKTPKKIPHLRGITQGSISVFHCILADEEGGIWVCGLNEYYELGIERETEEEFISTFVKLEGLVVNTTNNKKRFRNTKRALPQ